MLSDCPHAPLKFATPFKARAPGQVGEGVSTNVHLDLWLDRVQALRHIDALHQLPIAPNGASQGLEILSEPCVMHLGT
jgi:hypothetical protein